MSVSRLARSVLLLLVVLLPAGCNNREPPTIVTIRLLPHSQRVIYQGENIGETTARRELQQLADRERSSITNTATGMRIVIVSPLGANDARARELAQYCHSIGINSIQFQSQP